jgi:hypothetical protein
MVWWLIKTVIASLGIILIGHHIYKFLLARLTTPQTQNYVLRDSVVVARDMTDPDVPCTPPQSAPAREEEAADGMRDELTSFLMEGKLNKSAGETP